MKGKLEKIGFSFEKQEIKNNLENTDMWRKENIIILTNRYLKYSETHLKYVTEQFQNGDVGVEAIREATEDHNLIKRIEKELFKYEGKVEEVKNILLLEKENIELIGNHENKNIAGCFILKKI